MTDLAPRILAVIAELWNLARSDATLAVARARIAAAGGSGVELVYERDACGGHQFDAIVDQPDGALVIRCCPDRGVPFALHGAQRLSDRDLVRVDGEVLSVGQAIAMLDFVWSERPLLRRLLDICILRATLRAAPPELDDEAVQTALDRIRAGNGLYSAEATRRWMAERRMTPEMLEAYAEEQAAILALRDRVVGASVAPHFAAHHVDYDAATVAWVVIPNDAGHRSLLEHVLAGRLGFAAAVGLVLGAGRQLAPDELAITRVRRRELTAALREAVFERPAEQLHAISDGEHIILIHVFALHLAELDEATAEEISTELFDAWLAQQRAAARIEWNWGPADRIDIAARAG